MRILLAVDGSRSADRARDLIAALPWQESARVRIVSVASTVGEDEVLRVHRDALDAAVREIRSANSDLDVQPVLIRGRAASVIVDQAREMEADVIVLGHRGQGRWDSMLLGSVAAEVVDRAPCPVLVARDEHLGAVILADDGSPHARAAEGIVTRWPLFSGLPVTVVTVADGRFPFASTAAGRLREAGFDATPEARTGDPADQIIAAADEHGAGLIVVGTRGQTRLRRLILGSVAQKVLLNASCSVLVVREGARPDGRRVALRPEQDELVTAFG